MDPMQNTDTEGKAFSVSKLVSCIQMHEGGIQ